ncbi:unnamed protein product [Vitrella brassicaformis CCMP3155]|uniref:peptide-methionine (S)-S-oxide reductase n=2 Tax=Vitrella brassicaformis TaxID=1169539 RepID=A0A0G4EGJ8_VITBC|nr:unnamed protein product [Vitrella brassicaformis CCMP3155]|eukprot:CEL94605.1 unnamed protein product [Vitrella brassicaformis CCMP3155]
MKLFAICQALLVAADAFLQPPSSPHQQARRGRPPGSPSLHALAALADAPPLIPLQDPPAIVRTADDLSRQLLQRRPVSLREVPFSFLQAAGAADAADAGGLPIYDSRTKKIDFSRESLQGDVPSADDLAAAVKGYGYEVAAFAGGCFWCSEKDFEALKGVNSVVSGYTGGNVANPSYQQVSKGVTGHRESVLVVYDPSVTSYESLVDFFWRSIDPTDRAGQFCDKGKQYTSAIFVRTDAERRIAEESKKKLQSSGALGSRSIATEILPAATFFPAEDYHQDYYKKSSELYKFYRRSCGRDARLKQLWGTAEPVPS